MKYHRTINPIRARAVALTIAIGIAASCGSGESDDGTDEVPGEETTNDASTGEAPSDDVSTDTAEQVSGGASDAAAALEEAVLRLEGVSFLEPGLFVLDDPFQEYDASIEMYTLTVDSLEALRAEFPDAADVPPEGSETYASVLEHLDEWSVLARSTLSELEERRPELEPLTIEWAGALEGGDQGPPPQEYAELVDRNPGAFEEFAQRCAEFAVSVDVSINCFGTPPPDASGSIEFTAGGITFSVDPGPVEEYFVRPDFFAAEFETGDLMSISAPFPVRNPEAAIESDASNAPDGAPLDHPVPWPDDIDEYLAASPFEVIDDTTVSTPSGDFRRLTLAQDAVPAVSFIDLPPGPVVVRSARQPLTLWIGEVDGQTLIATLHAADVSSVEEYSPQVEEALGKLRPVG